VDGVALPSSGRASGAGDAWLFGLSLCSGAGGLDLRLHLALPEYRTVGHVERDAYAAAILVARMEDAALDPAPVWDDVATFDCRPWRGAVDIVTAGYPCQPFSVAVKRRGADDPRHLWPHAARNFYYQLGLNAVFSLHHHTSLMPAQMPLTRTICADAASCRLHAF
jgi:DNA (cytosine-5)-methyltransferase 1